MVSHEMERFSRDASQPGVLRSRISQSTRYPRAVCYLHARAAADWRRYRHRRPWRCLAGMPRRTLHAGATRTDGSDPSSTRMGRSECSNTVLCVVTVGTVTTQTGCSECSTWVFSVLTMAHFGCSHWGTLSTHTRVLAALTGGRQSGRVCIGAWAWACAMRPCVCAHVVIHGRCRCALRRMKVSRCITRGMR
jgi:hypothetical protein